MITTFFIGNGFDINIGLKTSYWDFYSYYKTIETENDVIKHFKEEFENKDLFRKNKKGVAIPHLNKDMFSNLPIPLPPLQEQQRIVEKLGEIFNEIDKEK